jgi:hypothetical protein
LVGVKYLGLTVAPQSLFKGIATEVGLPGFGQPPR